MVECACVLSFALLVEDFSLVDLVSRVEDRVDDSCDDLLSFAILSFSFECLDDDEDSFAFERFSDDEDSFAEECFAVGDDFFVVKCFAADDDSFAVGDFDVE